MDFAYLHQRLVGHLRERVRSGEWTERGLARLTGVSQPHMHNVLKGVRLLSSETADQLLRHLRIDLVDLLKEGPADPSLVPLAEGRVGPGYPFPDLDKTRERFPVWWPCPEKLFQPVLIPLGGDPAMVEWFQADDFALLDRAEHKRLHPDPASLYALDLGAEGLVRQAQNYVSPSDRNILELVKAKVVWIGRNLEPPRFATRSPEEIGREY